MQKERQNITEKEINTTDYWPQIQIWNIRNSKQKCHAPLIFFWDGWLSSKQTFSHVHDDKKIGMGIAKQAYMNNRDNKLSDKSYQKTANDKN